MGGSHQGGDGGGDPAISVIIPAYGRPQFLREAVGSVLDQTMQDFECIVVDDASPEPVEVPSDPRVRLIRRTDNGGPAAARNTGVESARGRYLTFLDDDDLYMPERLAYGLEGTARAPLAVCWIAPVGPPPGRRLWLRYLSSENRMFEGRVDATILDRLPPHLGQVTIDRQRMLPFRPRYSPAEDIEWWIRASQALDVTTVPRIGYRLRKHSAPRLNYQHEVRVRTNLYILEDHADWFAARPKAAARRWRFHALFAQRMGDRSLARQALRRSLRLDPSRSTLWHLARTYLP
jgi:glycosyltransferase involved in cell wall biosynthesis